MNTKHYTIEECKPFFSDSTKIIGNSKDKAFTHAAPITEAKKDSLVWVNPKKQKKLDYIEQTAAQIIILDFHTPINDSWLKDKCFIQNDNPKLLFTKIVKTLFCSKYAYGIHPTANIHPEAKISDQCYVGPFTYIGKSEVREGSIIHGHVYIYDQVTIGKNVTIHAGTVIGADGFGYARNEDKEFEQFPHIGGVIIEDNVDIGSNTSIDRGSLGNTLIKEGAKIDNLVHIAHNVVVGKHAAVIANSMIGGSTYIDDYAWIAPSAALMNGLKVNKCATVGLGAVLTKDVPEDEVWTGTPAKPILEFVAIQKKIKELLKNTSE